MYMVIRKYKVKGDKDELTSIIKNGFVPLISKIKGYVDYYFFYTDDGTLRSVGVFEDAKGAEDSVTAAADFVKKNLTKFLPEKPEIFSGEDLAHSRTGLKRNQLDDSHHLHQ